MSERGDRTVFVVDDDEAVRDSMQMLLESYGLSVRVFGTAARFSKSIPSLVAAAFWSIFICPA